MEIKQHAPRHLTIRENKNTPGLLGVEKVFWAIVKGEACSKQILLA